MTDNGASVWAKAQEIIKKDLLQEDKVKEY